MSTSDAPGAPTLPKAPELGGNDLSRAFPGTEQIAAWANEFFKAAGAGGVTQPALPTPPGTTSGLALQDPSTLSRSGPGQPPYAPTSVAPFTSMAAPAAIASDPMLGPHVNTRPDFIAPSIVASPTLGGIDPMGRTPVPAPQPLGREALARLAPSAAPSAPYYFLQQGTNGGQLRGPTPTTVDLSKLDGLPFLPGAMQAPPAGAMQAAPAGAMQAAPAGAVQAPPAGAMQAPPAGAVQAPPADAMRGYDALSTPAYVQDLTPSYARVEPAATSPSKPQGSYHESRALRADEARRPDVPTSHEKLPAVPIAVQAPPAGAMRGYDALTTPANVQDLTPSYARVEPAATSPGKPQGNYHDPRAQSPVRPDQFDVEAIRRDFPILQERVQGGKQLVWLDNAATTQKPQVVIDRLSFFYAHENSNIHRAAHSLAARSTDAYENARESVRRFLNAGSTEEIVFVRGTTEGINLISNAWGGRYIEAGDEIIVTRIEHHSNIVPWQMLCARTGAKLRVAEVDDTGQVRLDQYERLFNQHTRLVSFTHVSNALGTILPVAAMTEIAHRYGARVVIDGAQSVCHMRVDVQQLDADFYVFSGHKVFGPTGIGAVYGKKALLQSMPPWQGGGNMIGDVTFDKTEYQPAPARFEAGTGNIADAVGMGVALDYLEGLGLENVTRHEHELLEYGTAKLLEVPGLRLVGTAAEKAAVLGFVLENVSATEVGAALAANGIAVRAGHHCAQPALRRFGYEATVRPSLAVYNNKSDIDALVATLHDLQSRWLR